MKRLFRLSVVAACVVANFGFYGSAAPAAEEGVHSPNMKHVKTLPYKLQYGKTTPFGTDIEFARLKANGQTRDFALAGTYRNGLQIIDISNPESPKIASVYDCAIAQGDVQVFKRGNKTYAAYTADESHLIPTLPLPVTRTLVQRLTWRLPTGLSLPTSPILTSPRRLDSFQLGPVRTTRLFTPVGSSSTTRTRTSMVRE